ncbi:MAG: MoaD/ThiS family protein [Chloroflexi bacterium]|nr:MAG: MoaD/ThiS family protein [Chloroflexota bacterium]
MQIKVHLHTVLQLKTEDGLVRLVDVDLPEGGTARDVMSQLGIEYPESALLVVVNGRLAHLDHILQDADELHLMPSISGGIG